MEVLEMYYVRKALEISASHKLSLGYESKCQELHGHNWNIVIYLKSKNLDENGMVMDFTIIKQKISNKLDHKNLNEILNFNPTAENIAAWICKELGNKCYRVEVEESRDNLAIYEVE
jgi:6-pyruvoyltetrahydropterin/6-carboxytetrahydropterin synthase